MNVVTNIHSLNKNLVLLLVRFFINSIFSIHSMLRSDQILIFAKFQNITEIEASILTDLATAFSRTNRVILFSESICGKTLLGLLHSTQAIEKPVREHVLNGSVVNPKPP